MRVLFAPDSFTGTLTAAQATAALVEGWRRMRSRDDLVSLPMSDGGPGFVDAIATAWGRTGEEVLARTARVTGPDETPVTASYLLRDDIAFIESAQVCGLHLVERERRDPWRQSTAGLAELMAHARAAGAERIVIGLGGTGTIDAGLGFLGASGARAFDVDGSDVSGFLRSGPYGWVNIAWIDLDPVARAFADLDIVIASDVDIPLLGPNGAARGFGAQKFPDPTAVDEVELIHLDEVLARAVSLAQGGAEMVDLTDRPGAGAAGGLGWALLAVGAVFGSGVQTVMAAVGMTEVLAGVDLIVTGEGSLDWQSRRGKVVTGVAEAAAGLGIPVIAVAGRVDLGARELAAHGIVEAVSLSDQPGGLERALAEPGDVLAEVAMNLARQWSP